MDKLIVTTLLFLVVSNASANEAWLFELGLGSSYIQTNNNSTSTTDISPTLLLLANKKFTDNSSVGTGVELLVDNVLAWRLVNVNYLVTDKLNINFYGGVARYFREHPSFGMGAGIGGSYKLTNKWFIDFSGSYFSVDMSTSVPGDLSLGKKDDLAWVSLLLKRSF